MTSFYRACLLINALCDRGVRHMVLSPGSRNAPIMTALSHFPEIQVTLQPDERSAAYTAMGIAQATQLPVVVCCTSGTAAANHLPAVIEAHYMQVPLIVLTADRPSSAVDQRRGQTIRQPFLFGSYPLCSVNFSDDDLDADLLHRIRISPDNGPTHINLPLREPLYESADYKREHVQINAADSIALAPPKTAIDVLRAAKHPLVLIGQMHPSAALAEELRHWREANVLMAAEATANVPRSFAMQHIDRWCRDDAFQPDLLIAIGRDWVSKVIKNRFDCPVIHIEDIPKAPEPFAAVTVHYRTDAVNGLQQLRPHLSSLDDQFFADWFAMDAQRQQMLYVQEYPWSDFVAIRCIMQEINDDECLHLGNSSAVRYGLLSPRGNYPVFSNRGTAGIDGSLSAAMGQAIGSRARTWCVLGDVSFFYDHNAMWLKHLHCIPVVINNGGGHIFQLIDGPHKQPHIAEWQQSPTTFSVVHMAKAFGYGYLKADSEASLKAAITSVRNASTPQLIEVFTDAELSVKVWKMLNE